MGRVAFVLTISAGGLLGGTVQTLLTEGWKAVWWDSTLLIAHGLLGVTLGGSVGLALVFDRRPWVCALIASLLLVVWLSALRAMLSCAPDVWQPGGRNAGPWVFSAAIWAAALAAFIGFSRTECRLWAGIFVEVSLIACMMFVHIAWLEPAGVLCELTLLPRPSVALDDIWIRWPYAAGLWGTVWIVRLYALRCSRRPAAAAVTR